MMRQLGLLCAVALLLMVSATQPIQAANKEHQQLMADIRMLQQQNQRLQAQLLAVTELLKAVSARLDEQGASSRKGFADQRALTDTMNADLRVVREKIDETNVRLGALSEEVETLRTAQTDAATQAASQAAAFPWRFSATTLSGAWSHKRGASAASAAATSLAAVSTS